MNDEATGSRKDQDIDWENRVLCSDESCIGVIGPDGRCKECGKTYEGELPEAASPVDETVAEAASDEPVVEEAIRQPETPLSDPADDGDWEKRTLCSDGNCIGVIGADGRCKECGKPYAG